MTAGKTDWRNMRHQRRQLTAGVRNGAKEGERWHLRAACAIERVWRDIVEGLDHVDWETIAALVGEYRELVPDNVDWRVLARIGTHGPPLTSIPIAWVVPKDLVIELLWDCSNDSQRLDLVVSHADEILDQCSSSLSTLTSPAAGRALEAVACMRAGFFGPAQSHAANVIDSVVLRIFTPGHGKRAREIAVQLGAAPAVSADPSLNLLIDRAVLGPLESAYRRWYPNHGDPPPNGFARHSTAHAADIDAVFSPSSALLAIMLAASLVRRYDAALSSSLVV